MVKTIAQTFYFVNIKLFFALFYILHEKYT